MVTGSDNINQRPFEKDTGAGVSGESKGANVSGGDVENRQSKRSKNKVFLYILYFIQGIVVGFGAILPGISGGTLCVAFGMYRPMIETVYHVKAGLKKYGLMLLTFFAGVGAGFVGLSGIAAVLLEKNTSLVTCAFIGFIIGTFPELWRDAGEKGRKGSSIAAMIIGFAAMIVLLWLFRSTWNITVGADFWGFVLCGVLWGLSFIVPGLSSSTLLLFFGLYEPMLAGISRIDFTVLIPMALGMAGCVLLLSRAVGFAYKKQYAIVSHCVLGIVCATALMIFPSRSDFGSAGELLAGLGFIVVGAVVSFLLSRACDELKKRTEK